MNRRSLTQLTTVAGLATLTFAAGGAIAGPENLGEHRLVLGPDVAVAPGQLKMVNVYCPLDWKVLGGGLSGTSEGDMVVTESFPQQAATRQQMWSVYVKNNSGRDAYIARAHATCAT